MGVIEVQVPSLNERRDDILPIVRHFLYEFSHKFDKTFTDISPRAENALMDYNWIGNIRELKTLNERGVLTGKGPELTVKDLGIEDPYRIGAETQAGPESPFPPIPEKGIDLFIGQGIS